MLPCTPLRNLKTRRFGLRTPPLIPAVKSHREIVNLQARLHIEFNIPKYEQKNQRRNPRRIPAKAILSNCKNEVGYGENNRQQFQQRILQQLLYNRSQQINHSISPEDRLSEI